MNQSKTKKTRLTAVILNGLLLIAAAAGFASVFRQGRIGSVFLFFTSDSNLLAGISALCFLGCCLFCRNRPLPRWAGFLRYTATVCLTMTFFVVVLVLAPMTGGYYRMMIAGEFKFHHLICPVLSFVSFAGFEAREWQVTCRENLLSVLPAALYAAVLAVLNVAGKAEGPYPFLRVTQQPVWQSALWAVLLIGLCFLCGLVLRKAGRK